MAYQTIHRGAKQGVIREMRALAEATAQTMNVYMNDRVSDLMLWSKLRIIHDAIELAEMREDATDVLRNLVKDYPAYLAVLVLDDAGRCTVSSWHKFRGKNFADDPLFANAFKGEVALRDAHHDPRMVEINPENGGWTLGIAVPMKSGDSTIGVVCAFLKWSVIEQILSNARVGSTGYAYMVNKELEIIVHPSRDLYGASLAGEKVALPGLAKAVAAHASNYSYAWPNPPKPGRLVTRSSGSHIPAPMAISRALDGCWQPARIPESLWDFSRS